MKSCGAVLGIDVGWSVNRKSSAVCRLYWNRNEIDWRICRFRATENERENVLREAADAGELAVVAIDGPLRREFNEIGKYRSAERLLSRGEIRKRVGKPGQAISPNGKKLNEQANLAARFVRDRCCVGPAPTSISIDSRSIFEAFPTAFLGVTIDCPEALDRPRARSDRYFNYLAHNSGLERLLECMLPKRYLAQALRDIRNHDDRAALVCALTALCIAAGHFTAVGDDYDGWIVLPPKRCFADWSWKALCQQAASDNDGGKLQVFPG